MQKNYYILWKKILFIFFLAFLSLSSSAQNAQEVVSVVSIPEQAPNTTRVYAELLGHATNFLGLNKNVQVTIDLGQFQSSFKAYTLLDEEGKEIKFNSMVAAMNYMGERGWKFVQAYIITHDKQNIYHWLMYKDVSDKSQIYDDIRVKNTDSEPAKKQKKEKPKRNNELDDDIYR